jgi:hypothetical protein
MPNFSEVKPLIIDTCLYRTHSTYMFTRQFMTHISWQWLRSSNRFLGNNLLRTTPRHSFSDFKNYRPVWSYKTQWGPKVYLIFHKFSKLRIWSPLRESTRQVCYCGTTPSLYCLIERVIDSRYLSFLPLSPRAASTLWEHSFISDTRTSEIVLSLSHSCNVFYAYPGGVTLEYWPGYPVSRHRLAVGYFGLSRLG